MLYIVKMYHADDKISYAGKDSCSYTETPEAVFALQSAQGKARWWRKTSDGGDYVNLTHIEILEVDLDIRSGVPVVNTY